MNRKQGGPPLVSITSAFYNVAPYLLDMVRSIFAQTFTDWELVLLDDGSTDGSLRLAKSINDPRVRVYSNDKNLGIATSLNKLIALSHGRYIARMDADDMSAPMRIEKQITFMESHPEIDVVGCGTVSLDANDIPLGHIIPMERHDDICRAPDRVYGVAHPTIVAMKSWFEANRYDQSIRKSEDYELFLRTCRNSMYANISEPLYYYRLGSSFSLKKMFIHRDSVARFMFDIYAKQGQYGRALQNWFLSYLKLGVEVGACAVGAKNLYLAQRYKKITPEQKQSYVREIEQIKNTKLPIHFGTAERL